MKKVGLLLMVVFVAGLGKVMAGRTVATFKSAEGQKLQVIIGKKVINQEPKSVVKIKANSGTRQVKIKVFYGGIPLITKTKINLKNGYKSVFTIFVMDDCSLEVKKTNISRMYHKQYKRPDKFYNKRYYALLKRSKPNRLNDFPGEKDYKISGEAILEKRLLG